MRHGGLVYRGGHALTLLQGGAELFPALVQAMDQARSSIWLETYIFDFHGSAQSVAQALARAAQRGVQVRLVVDGVGTGELPEPWPAHLRAAGVQWRVFSPLGPLGLLIPSRWRRLHRKLCVVDGERLFCGGINILDDWHDPLHGALSEPRFDLAVTATGPVVSEAAHTMALLWRRIEAVRAVRAHQWPQAVMGWWANRPGPSALGYEAASPARAGARPEPVRGLRAALALRDNLRHRSHIERAYLRAIRTARQEVLIANAYFLPGRRLRRALVLAARRGVRVQLLLQGRYESFMQFHATRPVYRQLLAAGVEIHEYAPSFLHAKVAVVDGQWSTVGSSNLDPLSLLLAREANVMVRDHGFARQLRGALLQAMHHAGRQVALDDLAQRPWRHRLRDRVAFGLMRLALWLTGYRY
ncbi:cardiolipin synthase ClsB [Curvibacter sp. HBC61]|uniref:Cardiolipin synthase B n=1 Tax=Curvibacter cyanobacteriorum TaxID=3026422 RepID=A0ABT5MYX6_9BURK|nr:cardiolipin synthase ClsB [Curvibacter sp. HBC61]MDD0839266.1 cardiolipin synthase ClsB [Curvibacter sp. HBC61]